LVQLTDV